MRPQLGRTELRNAIQQVIQKHFAAGPNRFEVKSADARIASLDRELSFMPPVDYLFRVGK